MVKILLLAMLLFPFPVLAKEIPSAKQSIVINTPPEIVYEVIVDYRKYPEFNPNLKKVEILKRRENEVDVKHFLHLIIDVPYTLTYTETVNKRLEWKLLESSVLKFCAGYWSLAGLEKGKKTKATYFTTIEGKMFMPNWILRKLTYKDMPRMLERFKKRSEELYKKASDKRKSPHPAPLPQGERK